MVRGREVGNVCKREPTSKMEGGTSPVESAPEVKTWTKRAYVTRKVHKTGRGLNSLKTKIKETMKKT